MWSLTSTQKCTSRQDETHHAKSETSLSTDLSGGFKLSQRQNLDNTNVTGKHRLGQAFLQLNLAYDLGNSGSFAFMDLWTQKPFEKSNEAPLANYRRISIEQIRNAKKELWGKILNKMRGKLQPKTGEPKASDMAFTKFCEHPEFCNVCRLCRVPERTIQNVCPVPILDRGVATTLRAKANIASGRQRYQAQAVKCLTTAWSLRMANSCASTGKADDAQRRSNLASVAWLGIICVGRKGSIRTIRAMSALTDLRLGHNTAISPLCIFAKATSTLQPISLKFVAVLLGSLPLQGVRGPRCKQLTTRSTDTHHRCARWFWLSRMKSNCAYCFPWSISPSLTTYNSLRFVVVLLDSLLLQGVRGSRCKHRPQGQQILTIGEHVGFGCYGCKAAGPFVFPWSISPSLATYIWDYHTEIVQRLEKSRYLRNWYKTILVIMHMPLGNRTKLSKVCCFQQPWRPNT